MHTYILRKTSYGTLEAHCGWNMASKTIHFWYTTLSFAMTDNENIWTIVVKSLKHHYEIINFNPHHCAHFMESYRTKGFKGNSLFPHAWPWKLGSRLRSTNQMSARQWRSRPLLPFHWGASLAFFSGELLSLLCCSSIEIKLLDGALGDVESQREIGRKLR